MTMMTENYCNDCDEVLNAVVDVRDFLDFKVGRIRCKCGCVVLPCNECRDENGKHYDCGNCPYSNAKIVDAMTDDEYIKWVYENDRECFDIYLKGENGEYMKELAKKFLDKLNHI